MSQLQCLSTLKTGQRFILPDSLGSVYLKVELSSIDQSEALAVLDTVTSKIRWDHPSLLVQVVESSTLYITEVRIVIPEDTRATDNFKAFASITFNDSFVVKDLKVIKGTQGLFISMPSRKAHDRCPSCGGKNDIMALYCRMCGILQTKNRTDRDELGRNVLYHDVVHPINAITRQIIQKAVLDEYYVVTNGPRRNAGTGADSGY